MPWRNDFKSQMKDIPPSIPYLSLEAKLDEQALPVYRRSQIAIDLKGKGRSYSSPLPVSALDIIPSVSTDIFTPIPIVPRNFFDDSLPKELQLEILSSLIALHEADHERSVREGEWTVLRASSSKHRWVGKDKGIRELVKLSRASIPSNNSLNKRLTLLVGLKVVAGPRLRWSDVEQFGPARLP
jgi:F-box/leucine-rich repeat protein 2/20